MKSFVLSGETAQLVHLFFEWLAIAAGVQLYRRQRARHGAASVLQSSEYGVVIGCILGAGIGNKLVFWLEVPHLWTVSSHDVIAWMSGQSIVGGLLGGLVGVELAKKLTGVKRSTGDDFILPLMVGTIVGRIGCFLSGLHDGTYGIVTTLPWGVDFGDGIARHPTQIYDMLFVLLWGGALLQIKKKFAAFSPGLSFKFYLAGYLGWRLLIDNIKPIPYLYPFGMSGIQWICLIAIGCYFPFIVRQILHKERYAFFA